MTVTVNFYATGTLTATNNSSAITGSGTAWVANANAGQMLMIINGSRVDFCPIQSVNSDAGITLQSNYIGGSGSTVYAGLSYMIVPIQGYQQAVANQLASMVSQIQAYSNLTPSNGDFLQYIGGTPVPTTRSALQVLKSLFTSVSEASVASASSCTLFGSSVLSPRVQMTGTTTINYFDTIANCVTDVRVSGASLTITNNAGSVPSNFSAISCPGSVNLVLAAGDRFRVETDGTGAPTITRVHRANGTFVGAGFTTLAGTVSANAIALPAGPTGTLLQIANADAVATRLLLDAFGTSTGSHLNLRTARGTNTSKTAVQSGDVMGAVGAYGYGATGYSAASRANIQMIAAENWTDSAQGAYTDFFTTPSGGTSTALALRLLGNTHALFGTTVDNGAITVGGNIMAEADNTRSLGSASFQFASLYLGTSLVFLGTTVAGKTGTGNLVLSAGATLTGTLTAAVANFSGIVGAPAGIGTITSAIFPILVNNVEVARYDTSARYMVGTTAANSGSMLTVSQATSGVQIASFVNTHASNPFGTYYHYSAAAPNGSSNEFIYCDDSSALRASIRSNGGLANFSANNANLSDATVKPFIENIANDNALAAALWDAHKLIDWNRHKYEDQTHDDWNYGYTAQGIQRAFAKVAPELVDLWNPGKSDKLAVYHHDVTNITGMVVTMLQTRTDTIESEVGQLREHLAAANERISILEGRKAA